MGFLRILISTGVVFQQQLATPNMQDTFRYEWRGIQGAITTCLRRFGKSGFSIEAAFFYLPFVAQPTPNYSSDPCVVINSDSLLH